MRSILCKPATFTYRQPKSITPRRVQLQKAPIATRKQVINHSQLSLNDMTYFMGKSIILYTMFYCTLNWAFYRNVRKDIESHEEENKNKK